MVTCVSVTDTCAAEWSSKRSRYTCSQVAVKRSSTDTSEPYFIRINNGHLCLNPDMLVVIKVDLFIVHHSAS